MFTALDKIRHLHWTLPLVGLVLALTGAVTIGLALYPHMVGVSLLDPPRPAYDFSLQGPDGAITPVASKDGIFFEKKLISDIQGNYEVEHTVVVRLVERQGNVRMVAS